MYTLELVVTVIVGLALGALLGGLLPNLNITEDGDAN